MTSKYAAAKNSRNRWTDEQLSTPAPWPAKGGAKRQATASAEEKRQAQRNRWMDDDGDATSDSESAHVSSDGKAVRKQARAQLRGHVGRAQRSEVRQGSKTSRGVGREFDGDGDDGSDDGDGDGDNDEVLGGNRAADDDDDLDLEEGHGGGGSGGDGDDDGEEHERVRQAREQLKDVPLSELLELQKMGYETNVRRKRVREAGSDGEGHESGPARKKRSHSARDRPREQPSTVPPSLAGGLVTKRLSLALGSTKKGHAKRRDPRFDSAVAGSVDRGLWQDRFSHVIKQREEELEQLHKALRSTKSDAEKDRLRRAVTILKQQVRTQEESARKLEARRERKRTERDLVAAGKKPYFLKKSDERMLDMLDKYSRLKEQGKLQKFINKKRKRNVERDRRHMAVDYNE